MDDLYDVRRRNVAEIIRRWCAGIIATFAKKTNLDASYVSRILYEPSKKGAKRIDTKVVQKILAAYGLPPGWLDTDQTHVIATMPAAVGRPAVLGDAPATRKKLHAYSVRPYTEEGDLDPEREFLVDEVDIQLSAGSGTLVPEFVETKYRMPFQQSWFRKHHAKPENVRLMRVHGNSMESLVYDGDRVAVHLTDKQIVNGRVYALIYGEDTFGRVKRLFRTKDGGLRIVSDNPDKELFPDELVSGKDLERVFIIGRVIDKSGSGGL